MAVEPRGLEVAADWSSVRSGETYLGCRQASGFVGGAGVTVDRPHVFQASPRLPLNTWDLTGLWTVGPDAVRLVGDTGCIAFQFHARDVNLVMGPVDGGTPVPFRVSLDGRPPVEASGTDVDADGGAIVRDQGT